jgi:predicted ATPase
MKQFGPFQFDPQNECLWHDGLQICVKPKPFSVLRYLIENPQRLVTQDELLDALWPETYVQPQVLRTYVLELRKLLGDDADNPRFIATVPKRGYRFMAEVAEMQAAATGHSLAGNAGRFSDAIVGRDQELHLLDELLEKAIRGERQIVFVTGEMGMGKTALVDACSQSAREKAVVARGQSVEGLGGKEPYYPIVELLGSLLGGHGTSDPDREKRRQLFAQIAPGWSALIGNAPANGASATWNRDRMLGELCEGLEALAAEQPMLLIVEDLHWADSATLDFLCALVRRRSAARLMLLATFRPAEAATNPTTLKQLKQDLVTRRLGTVIALRPIDEDSAAAYLAQQLAQAAPGIPPSGVASFVHHQSEGNPLFMMAIVDHLLSQRLLVHEADAWRVRAPLPDVDVGLPADLAEMIELEIGQRSSQEQRLLEAGAVCGVVFPVWAAAAALGLGDLDAEEEYEALAGRIHFLHAAGHDELPDGSRSTFYVLSHRIYREVLYRRQPVARRSRAHLQVAARLQSLFAGRNANIAHELAAHFEAAGEWVSAAEALCASAENAIVRRSGSEAAAMLTRALELLQNLDAQQRAAREASIQKRIAGLATALNDKAAS